MFSASSQLKYWTFSGTSELTKLREETNRTFVENHGDNFEAVFSKIIVIGVDIKYQMKAHIVLDTSQESYSNSVFLTPAEERLVIRHYEYVLKEFCKHFSPPMPSYVMGTGMIYLKRFYLHNSVMDYHPKDIVYTCVYLACKVEEFNVSITQFVGNLKGDRDRATDILLTQELLLMQELRYHLTVYNCYRPLEGQLIDIKTRCPEIDQPERLRRGAEDFIDRAYNTDVCLVFAPAQIAIAALLSSGSKVNINLDSYVANTLLGSGTNETLMKAIEQIKRIRYMVKNQDPLEREEVRAVEAKLEKCRNPLNNPDSDVYKENLQKSWEDEDDRRMAKNKRKADEERRKNLEVLS